jgi:aminotransferase
MISFHDRLVPHARDARQSDIRAATRIVESMGGINLAQGTCALPVAEELVEAASRAMRAGYNSYTLFDGIPRLKEAVARRYNTYNQISARPENVLVTSGATGAFEVVCKSLISPGNRVVMFEPIYQYHVRQARHAGADVRFVPLAPPEWIFDPAVLEDALSGGARLLVLSNPHNPSGKVFTRAELETVAELCIRHDAVAVVDEVYEYILGPSAEHISLASLPGMFERTLTLSSASKTFFVTGWRVGWLAAPPEVLGALGRMSDETYVCAPAPFQHAVAEGLGFPETFFERIRTPFHERMRRLVAALEEIGWEPCAPRGAYYVLARYPPAFAGDDRAAMHALLDATGVAAVPGREFFPSRADSGMLRFCYAVPDETLERACDQMMRLRPS